MHPQHLRRPRELDGGLLRRRRHQVEPLCLHGGQSKLTGGSEGRESRERQEFVYRYGIKIVMFSLNW
jgi:hypothetical protein